MADYQTTLQKLHTNLNILRQRESKYAGNAPLDLLNQITDHETAITLTGQGSIPYAALLKRLFASTTFIPAVIFEYEDKQNPLASLPFLNDRVQAGLSRHQVALAARWLG